MLILLLDVVILLHTHLTHGLHHQALEGGEGLGHRKHSVIVHHLVVILTIVISIPFGFPMLLRLRGLLGLLGLILVVPVQPLLDCFVFFCLLGPTD